ncbi:MAG: MBL fold metallo-hydrolase [Candidatus Nanopelagicales bacterium]
MELLFIGTATTLLKFGPFRLLTDPNFLHKGQRAYLGRGMWSKRLTEPACQPADLPQLDAVVLSHLHGDHFDRVARRDLDREVPVITTIHAARHLDRWGFATAALDTWQQHTLATDGHTLSVIAVPAVHARGLLGRILPPVMGSVITHTDPDGQRFSTYISGDTLTGDHVDAIHERFPDLDAAVVHLGGTRILLHTVTMDDVQGVDLLRRLEPPDAIAVHHDDYRVFRSPVQRFLARAAHQVPQVRVHVPKRGERVSLVSSQP